jgi:hypothetical protein
LNVLKNLVKTSVLVFAVTLILTLTSAPVTAGVNPPSMEIDPHPTITATVSTQFTIQVWIRNIPKGYSMTAFDFVVVWDPTQVELVDHQPNTPPGKSWGFGMGQIGPHSIISSREASTQADYVDFDFAWVSLTFHCLAEGTSKIRIETVDTVWLSNGGTPIPTIPEPFEITCNQVAPRPVGGVVVPTSKLEIVAPFAALAGLIAAVSAVVVVKKRRD